MKLEAMPYEAIDWEEIRPERHEGETGFAEWRVKRFGDIRVRLVRYSPGYRADHWCPKGHIIHCLAGSMISELQDGRKTLLRAGMSYVVEDDAAPHRSSTEEGVLLFIVD